jgi:hypothetical protein
LIGFTIVLAALVMRWGGTLFQKTTTTQSCASNARIKCLDIDLGLTEAHTQAAGGDELTITVQSNTNEDVQSFWFRAFKSDGSTGNYDHDCDNGAATDMVALTWHNTSMPLSGYGVDEQVLCFDGNDGDDNAVRVQVIPVIFYEDVDAGESCTVECSENARAIEPTWT